jgi:hypothetical protein
MQPTQCVRTRLLLLAITFVFCSMPVAGEAAANMLAAHTGVLEQDGPHGFDFEIGTWKTHLRRLLHPLTGSTTWAEYQGTTVVNKVWSGRANLLELEVDGPAGHIEGLNLRLYNPQSHQWSLNFANSKSGILGQPTIGEFTQGRGEFFDQETFNGRAILVRFVISDITPNSCHFEQAFSDNGGKSWEVNWIADDTLANAAQTSSDPKESVSLNPAVERDRQHDFDFEIGAWKIRLSRLLHPLSGSSSWSQFDGSSVTRKVWDGRANFEEFETNGTTGHIEGLTLRTYNPQSHQWSIYWANSKDGTLGRPMIGGFQNGRGEFYDQEAFNGRTIFVRYIWSGSTPQSAHFEQSFSNDGGKTWEVNWVTDQIRVHDESDKTH